MKTMMLCPTCMKDREFEIRKEMETYPVKGESITIEADVTYCNVCGEQIWNQELDDGNIMSAFRAFREKNKLLQPEEIRSIREKYDLTQVAFAQILGLGEKTIARYETGSLQDAAPNTLISLAKYPGVFKNIVETNKARISESLYQSVSERISDYEAKTVRRGGKITNKANTNRYVKGRSFYENQD